MDAIALARLVQAMRQHQADYFKARRAGSPDAGEILRASKAAEAAVDRAVAQVIDGQQTIEMADARDQEIAALRQQVAERDATIAENEKEISEHQDNVRDRMIDGLKEAGLNGDRIDGGGCDSGDWRDFTESEVGQGLGIALDALDEMKTERDAALALLRKAMLRLRDKLPLVHVKCECADCQLIEQALAALGQGA